MSSTENLRHWVSFYMNWNVCILIMASSIDARNVTMTLTLLKTTRTLNHQSHEHQVWKKLQCLSWAYSIFKLVHTKEWKFILDYECITSPLDDIYFGMFSAIFCIYWEEMWILPMPIPISVKSRTTRCLCHGPRLGMLGSGRGSWHSARPC